MLKAEYERRTGWSGKEDEGHTAGTESRMRSDESMAAVRWFRVTVFQGDQTTKAYFYETDSGLFDLQYGWANYMSRMHESLDAALSDFRSHLQAEQDARQDETIVRIGTPVEVGYNEVRQASPAATKPPEKAGD